MTPSRALLLPALLLAVPTLAACTENASSGSADGGGSSGGTITVRSTDDACELSATRATAGQVSFSVHNVGSKVTEFYLYGEGDKIEGEVENIGPGLTRTLTVAVDSGTYQAACKPGMSGDGIRQAFTVTGAGSGTAASTQDAALVAKAQRDYQGYVEDQADLLVARTDRFVRLFEARRDDAARALYPLARTPWERIETVAESFADLDASMDTRAADLESGQRWTGWHRIEKELWPARAQGYTPMTDAQRREVSDLLVQDTDELRQRVSGLDIGLDEIANGSQGLMEEVASGKVTGEEEYWSRTDLYDFQANLDGARRAFDDVRALVEAKDPGLERELAQRFATLQRLLDQHRDGRGFVSYDELTTAQVKALADAVNAVAEPLSQITPTVLS